MRQGRCVTWIHSLIVRLHGRTQGSTCFQEGQSVLMGFKIQKADMTIGVLHTYHCKKMVSFDCYQTLECKCQNGSVREAGSQQVVGLMRMGAHIKWNLSHQQLSSPVKPIVDKGSTHVERTLQSP